MRYYVESLAETTRVRAALDVLAGLPKPSGMPSPPRAPTYSEGARGWIGHLVSEPRVMADGGALLEMPEEVDQYLGQSADVSGELVTVPTADELVTTEQLSPEYQAELQPTMGG